MEGEPAEAKEEPAKEETPSVRSKMEVSTPQKVWRYHSKERGFGLLKYKANAF